jgi:hypothetical protein
MNDFVQALKNQAARQSGAAPGVAGAPEAQADLWRALGRGDRQAALASVKNGADPRAADENGNDALMLAVKHERWPLAEELMEVCGGARQNKHGESALHLAVSRGSSALLGERAQKLLAICDPSAMDQNGFTPLMRAAHAGASSAILVLAKKGGQTTRSAAGMTAFAIFSMALARHNLDEAEPLYFVEERKEALAALAQNGGAQALTDDGDSALHLALKAGFPERAEELAKWCPPFGRNRHGQEPLDALPSVCAWRGLPAKRAMTAVDALSPTGAEGSAKRRSRLFSRAIEHGAFGLADELSAGVSATTLRKVMQFADEKKIAEQAPKTFARIEKGKIASEVAAAAKRAKAEPKQERDRGTDASAKRPPAQTKRQRL